MDNLSLHRFQPVAHRVDDLEKYMQRQQSLSKVAHRSDDLENASESPNTCV